MCYTVETRIISFVKYLVSVTCCTVVVVVVAAECKKEFTGLTLSSCRFWAPYKPNSVTMRLSLSDAVFAAEICLEMVENASCCPLRIAVAGYNNGVSKQLMPETAEKKIKVWYDWVEECFLEEIFKNKP